MQPRPEDEIRGDLSLQRYAAITAELRAVGRDRAPQILAREGLSPQGWASSDQAWKEEIDGDLDGKQGFLLAYADLVRTAWRSAVVEPPAPAPPISPPIATSAVAVSLPSYLLAAAHAPIAHVLPPVVRAPASMVGTMGVDLLSAAPTLPFVSPTGPVQPSVTGTTVGRERPQGPALPFAAASAPVAPAPAAVALPKVVRAPASMTGTVGVSDSLPPSELPFREAAPRLSTGTSFGPTTPSAGTTPFQPVEPEALGFTLARYAELQAARSEPGADQAKVLAEFGIDAAGHAQLEGYWARKFSKNGLLGLELGRLLEQANRALAERRALRAAPVEAPSELSPEQYAWLVATLRKATPAELPATLVRLRLTSESRRELEDRWSKRMAADASLKERFLAALATRLAGSC